jgi:sugar-specific transcriptional regulator TrmB
MDIKGMRPVLTTAAKKLYRRILAGDRPHRRDQPVLAKLIEAELVVADQHREGFYEALDPERAAHRLQSALQLAAARALTEAQLIPSQLQDLSADYRLAHPTRSGPGFEVVAGFREINERLGVVVASCQSELITAQPSGPRPAHILAMSYKQDLAVLQERRASMRTLYLPSVRQDLPTARWATMMTQAGAQIRTSNNFGRMIIVDRRVAVTSVLSPECREELRADQALFVTNEDAVRTLVASFERDWKRAEPWDGSLGGPVLSAQHRTLLDKLATGLEIGAAAAEMKMSPRTAATRIAEARQVANASSLPQLLYWWGRQEYQI